MKNKRIKLYKISVSLALLFLLTLSFFIPFANTAYASDAIPVYTSDGKGALYTDNDDNVKETSSDTDGLLLYPGGMTFGIKIQSSGATVLGLSEFESGDKKCRPATDAGIKEHDIIIKIDGTPVSGAKDAVNKIEASRGKKITVTVQRKDGEMSFDITPKIDDSDGKYKIGIWVKDTTAGIGTVTFINPKSLIFGGLGHGIYDSESGKLVPMSRGTCTDVKISGVVRGESGHPGEIRGQLLKSRTGIVISNTECGTFGVLSSMPDNQMREPMHIAKKSEVHEGAATILSSFEDGVVREYAVTISNINANDKKTKNFTVKVCDKSLLDKTGGIVQGMSGSPIIQDGKIIGAVTHVLINDPSEGYGIFIENMLNSSPKEVK